MQISNKGRRNISHQNSQGGEGGHTLYTEEQEQEEQVYVQEGGEGQKTFGQFSRKIIL